MAYLKKVQHQAAKLAGSDTFSSRGQSHSANMRHALHSAALTNFATLAIKWTAAAREARWPLIEKAAVNVIIRA